MSTLPDDVPDEVSTADYVDQHTTADPSDDLSEAEVAGAPVDTGRVEAHELGADLEADEADLLEQATSVPSEDEQLDEE